MTLLVTVNNDVSVVSVRPGVACQTIRHPCSRQPDHDRFVRLYTVQVYDNNWNIHLRHKCTSVRNVHFMLWFVKCYHTGDGPRRL